MTDRPLMQNQYRSNWPWVKEIQQLYDAGRLTPAQALPYGPRPAEELHDRQNDPHRVTNLADDPELKPILDKMRGLLAEWIDDTDDRGQYPIPEAELRAVKKRFPSQAIGPEFQNL